MRRTTRPPRPRHRGVAGVRAGAVATTVALLVGSGIASGAGFALGPADTASAAITRTPRDLAPGKPAPGKPAPGKPAPGKVAPEELASRNLALGAALTSSSDEAGALSAAKAADGNATSRWASRRSDAEWLVLDLRTPTALGSIALDWEAAYADRFTVQVRSSTTAAWTTVVTEDHGRGGSATYSLGGTTARYVRVLGVKRHTQYGYSLFEVRIAPATSSPAPADGVPLKGDAVWQSAGAAGAIADSGASWFYDWSTGDDGVKPSNGAEFVPMVWGPASVSATALAQAKAQGTTLLGFNEPDLAGQAVMTPAQALALWPQLESTGMRLGAPAVAYGAADANGWLAQFMAGASRDGRRVDFIPLHWYGGDFTTANAVSQLRSYLEATHAKYGKPLWLTEFALMYWTPNGTVYATPEQQVAFIAAATTMLDSLPYVERYAWFSLTTPSEGGTGTGLYTDNAVATPMGQAYRKVR